nr:hypothetical protein ZK682.3 - Caenorhabditis elegans [Caenorhabditis elegans]
MKMKKKKRKMFDVFEHVLNQIVGNGVLLLRRIVIDRSKQHKHFHLIMTYKCIFVVAQHTLVDRLESDNNGEQKFQKLCFI